MARTRPFLREETPAYTLSVPASSGEPLRTCASSRMIIYKHMRLLLLHFNSGRIPCWSPTRAAPSPSSVWVASSRAWFRSSMLSKVNDYILEMWPLNLLWRLHEGDFKACCYHSSIPVRLGACEFLSIAGSAVQWLSARRRSPRRWPHGRSGFPRPYRFSSGPTWEKARAMKTLRAK